MTDPQTLTSSVLDNPVEPERLPSTDHRLLSKEYRGIGRNYTPDERMMAMAIYAETGSTVTVSKTMGIPLSTFQGWLKQDDSDALIESLRYSMRYNVAWKAAQGAELAVTLLLERMNKGDEVMGKDGEIRTVAVRARDLAAIHSILVDKWTLLTGGMQGKKAEAGLPALAKKLEDMLRNQGVEVKPGALGDL